MADIGASAASDANESGAGVTRGARTGAPSLGSGKVLGSTMTDTLGVEMCYGIDGKTELEFFGEKYIFAPVALCDLDEASMELQRIDTLLLAFGLVKPLSPADEITPADLANMLRVLSGRADVTEIATCSDVALLFWRMKGENLVAIARLIRFSIIRHHPDVTEMEVRRWLDASNTPILLRLWFRKNVGVLDRFLQRLAELMPPAEVGDVTNLPQTETIDPKEFARLLSLDPEPSEGEDGEAILTTEEILEVEEAREPTTEKMTTSARRPRRKP